MELLSGPPSLWHVVMPSGAVIELWADGYSSEAGEYVFSTLVRATLGEQSELDVVGQTPTDQARVLVAVARLPRGEVASLHTASERARESRCVCAGV